MPATARGSVTEIFMDDFSGGVNYTENPYTLPAPLLPAYALNVTLKGRCLSSRYGGTMAGTLGAASKYIYYSVRLDAFFSQEGTGLYTYALSATNQLSARTLVHTFSTSDKIMVCDFAGLLVGVHPVDGVFTWTGAVFAIVAAGVRGNCIAAWQNKVWVGGDPNNPSRVWWCNAGAPATWTTATDFADLREVNDQPVTAIGVGNGQDVVGRGALMVFKANSTYRIYSATTGAFTTLDGSRGAAGSEAVTTCDTYVYFCNFAGVYRLSGDSVETISGPITAQWDNGDTYSNPYVCWAAYGRLYVSNGGTRTNGRFFFEYIPERRAWFPWAWGDNSGISGRAATYSATEHNKSGVATTPTAGAFVLDYLQTKVMMHPNPPEGSVASFVVAAGVDYKDGTNDLVFPCVFPLPTVHLQGRRFGIERLGVQGWGGHFTAGFPDLVPVTATMYFRGSRDSQFAAAGGITSTFSLYNLLDATQPLYAMAPGPVGAYTNLRPLILATAGCVHSSNDGVIPGVGISAVHYRLTSLE